MKQTYWDGNGRFQEMVEKLNTLIPAKGSVYKPRSLNRYLERFRKASNAYYDLFNNGGLNQSTAIRNYFDFNIGALNRIAGNYKWEFAHQHTEPAMDRYIIDAAVEQGLITSDEADQMLPNRKKGVVVVVHTK